MVDVAREPRWGRVEETYGEDPYLVSRLGIAAVQGFQGDGTFRDKKHVIATLKHFAAHGQPESGNNCAPVNVSERLLRETFLYTFEAAIREGGAMSVMASYNEIDGVPVARQSLAAARRAARRMGLYRAPSCPTTTRFASWPNGRSLYGHHVAHDGKEAAALAVRAGVNIELPEPDCYKHLVELVQRGHAARNRELDELVAPMLGCKFRAWPVRRSVCRSGRGGAVGRLRRASQLALEGGAQDDHASQERRRDVAPLDCEQDQDARRDRPERRPRAAGRIQRPAEARSTVLEGIRAARRRRVEVLYHEGCKITIGGSWQQDEVYAERSGRGSPQASPKRPRSPTQADVIVLAIGGNEQTSREAWMGNHLGDRASLDMVGRQDELVDAMAATGKPIVALVFNGRPLSIRNVAEKAAAHFRVLVPRPGDGHRGRRGTVRRRQPRRQTADHDSALGRPRCRLTTTTSRPPAAAICSTMFRRSSVRLWLELHDFPIRSAAAGKATIAATNRRAVVVDVTNTGSARATKSCSSTFATWSAPSLGP